MNFCIYLYKVRYESVSTVETRPIYYLLFVFFQIFPCMAIFWPYKETMALFCKTCLKPIRSNLCNFFCDICKNWYHLKWIDLKRATFISLSLDLEDWYCLSCMSNIFPFIMMMRQSIDLKCTYLCKDLMSAMNSYQIWYLSLSNLNRI